MRVLNTAIVTRCYVTTSRPSSSALLHLLARRSLCQQSRGVRYTWCTSTSPMLARQRAHDMRYMEYTWLGKLVRVDAHMRMCIPLGPWERERENDSGIHDRRAARVRDDDINAHRSCPILYIPVAHHSTSLPLRMHPIIPLRAFMRRQADGELRIHTRGEVPAHGGVGEKRASDTASAPSRPDLGWNIDAPRPRADRRFFFSCLYLLGLALPCLVSL